MTDYYVSVTGSDSNPGSITLPWKNVAYGTAHLYPGDNLYIRIGTYQEYITTWRDGTASQPITIQPYGNETVIIDGNNYILPGVHDALIHIGSDYWTVTGLLIQYSGVAGVVSRGSHVNLIDIEVDHSWTTGIGVEGTPDSVLVEGCDIHDCCQINSNGDVSDNPAGLAAIRYPTNTIFRKNKVHHNYGEGIVGVETTGLTLEDNESYDNWHEEYAFSNVLNGIMHRNIGYATGAMTTPNSSQYGIVWGNEVAENVYSLTANCSCINNIIYGCLSSFRWGDTGISMNTCMIAFNTFVNCTGINGNIYLQSTVDHINSTLVNNIIVQDDSKLIIYSGTYTGLTFKYNLWSKSPNVNARGIGDVIGDPLLTKTNTYTDPLYYKLQSSSPAIGGGITLATVRDDYWGTIRSSTPTIGAYEGEASPPQSFGIVNGMNKLGTVYKGSINGVILGSTYTGTIFTDRSD